MTVPQTIKTRYQKKTLGELIDFIDGDRGTNYPSQGEFYPSGHCLFLSTRNVPNSKFIFEENFFIDEKKDAVLRKGKLQRGDYVLTTRGTVGNFAYYDSSVPYDNVRINSGMVILRKKTDEIDEKFFRYYLSSNSFSGQVKSRVSGSAQPQLPIRDMVSMEIILPDKKTQSRIASILSPYDDLIDNNEKRIKALEEMSQLLYTEWFVKFKFPGHEKVRIVDSGTEYGKIPEGWAVKKLADVTENVRTLIGAGTHLSERQYVPIENISRKSFILRKSSSWQDAKSSLVLFEKGDLLFGVMRPYFHKVAIAMKPGVTRTTCLVLRPKHQIFLSLALMTVFSNKFISFATSNTQGATIPYAVWEKSLENYKLLIPDDRILYRFEKFVNQAICEANNLSERNQILSQARDLLIPQLVTGRREVKL